MNLGNPSARRFVIRGLLLVALAAVLFIWFIPEVSKADLKAPVHTEAGFGRECAQSVVAPPNYGTRESINDCAS